jgi:hypothetical protein
MTTTEISCVEVWRKISNYIDGDVSPELRARMEAHFKNCKHCTAIHDGTRNVVRLIGDGNTKTGLIHLFPCATQGPGLGSVRTISFKRLSVSEGSGRIV